ncbi:MAG TPA: (2Fe-2S)-binding protein [Stellaceae bacterium]|jgi:bacterioferritin-associated ferredoxin|nr:(2Fe-2S)-binding protein [Stellaceae bacterium]
MYVCLCNAITDRDFRAHAAHAECAGCSVSAVYRSLGKKPQCGKCVPFVRQLLRQVVEAPARLPAVAAAG